MTRIRDFPFDPLWAEAIRAIWDKIDGDNLSRWEQSLLIKTMAAALNEPRPSPPHRLSAQQVIEAARSFTDE